MTQPNKTIDSKWRKFTYLLGWAMHLHYDTEGTLEIWRRTRRMTYDSRLTLSFCKPRKQSFRLEILWVISTKEFTFSCIGRYKYLVVGGKNQWIVLDFPPSPPVFFMLVPRYYLPYGGVHIPQMGLYTECVYIGFLSSRDVLSSQINSSSMRRNGRK